MAEPEMFYSAYGKRPVHLSKETRRFADESMHHRYGLDTRRTMEVVLDDVEGFESMSPLQRHDAAIARIAATAPVRVCPGEKISGAATLGRAIGEEIPATYHGNILFSGISHLTTDYETVLKEGLVSIRRQAEVALERYRGTEKEAFAQSCVNCLDAFDVWHQRYLDALRNRPEYAANYANLCRVPMAPAGGFYEAVQSLWFVFAFMRLCGNWPGIGRIDVLLGDYLDRDLAAGKLTLDEAREILAHFFIKGCEWICGGEYRYGGDAQHYQNIVLGGVDEKGKDVANRVTYLALDILEETGISDFPTTVRLNGQTDEKLLRRVAEVMRHGGGVIAVYNEEMVRRSMERFGYLPEETARFANDGCWEVQVPGKTYFSYVPFDALQILQKRTLRSYDGTAAFDSFEDLYRCYAADLREEVLAIARKTRSQFLPEPQGCARSVWKPTVPCTVVSLFEKDCVERGLSYLEGGPVYNVVSPHIGGFADVVDSLLAIRNLVFEEQKLTFAQLMDVLRCNWEGQEPLRQYVVNRYDYYGCDHDDADALAARLLDSFADACDEADQSTGSGYRFPAGVSTFGRQLAWSGSRLAVPHGYKAGAVLAGNCSPTPGTDRDGATAIIRSYCKLPLERMATGAALDIRLTTSSVRGEDGLSALMALMRGFVALGGFFMQLDVADAAVLRDAQLHPENYQTLSVRVSGWNARFVTLNREWQDMIIEQTEK